MNAIKLTVVVGLLIGTVGGMSYVTSAPSQPKKPTGGEQPVTFQTRQSPPPPALNLTCTIGSTSFSVRPIDPAAPYYYVGTGSNGTFQFHCTVTAPNCPPPVGPSGVWTVSIVATGPAINSGGAAVTQGIPATGTLYAGDGSGGVSPIQFSVN